MPQPKQKISIFWFRRDLRLHDNVALFQALQSEFPVLPIFIFDTDILNQLDDKADRRVDLIHQMLAAIQNKLAENNRTLRVFSGKVLNAFAELSKEFEIQKVYCNRDYETYALGRDKSVKEFLENKGIDFLTFKDQVVFEWNEVLKPDGQPYTIFTPFSKTWKRKLAEIKPSFSPSEKHWDNFYVTETKFPFPTLESLGFEKTNIQFFEPTIPHQSIENYHLSRDIPSLENGTTKLSLHLRFGTVSIRGLVALARDSNETWLNELIWREFFMSILMHFPHVEKGAFKKKYDQVEWRNNEEEFDRWCRGKTGYPIVDAGMRQLNETGFMHNRVRMIVASFLVKDLLIDWRWGEAYFASKLLDYDLSANNGNWQWAAGCGCDAAPYFRIFNPTEQTKRFDPKLEYIKRWVPELDTFEYPSPIVDHRLARERVLKVYKQALSDI